MSDNKFPFTCPKCGQRFSITAPTPGVMNDLRCSVVVAPHEKPIVVRDGGGKELWVSNSLIHEDAEGIYLIEITLADTDQG